MEKRNYTHVQALLSEIRAMLAEGKTQREVAEYYGFRDKQVVKRLLERERRKERKLEAGILPRPKGCGSCGAHRTAAGTQLPHLRLPADVAVAEKPEYLLQSQNCAANHEEI